MRRFWAVLLSVAACAAIAYHVSAQPRPGASDDREIRAASAAFADAYSKGDPAAVLAFWADDADYVDDTGTAYRGKPAIAALLKKSADGLKGHTMSIAIASVKFLKPDVALDEGVVTITPPGGVGESNRYVAVWVKSDGKWRLSSVRDQPVTAAADAPSAAVNGLAWMAGTWGYEGNGVSVALSCKMTLGGQFLSQEYQVSRAGQPAMTVVQYVGWDPTAGRLRSWVFDSEGGFGQAFWGREGNTWTATAEGILGDGRAGTATNVIRFVDDGTFAWKTKDRTVDGQPVADSEITFTRKGDAPAKGGN